MNNAAAHTTRTTVINTKYAGAREVEILDVANATHYVCRGRSVSIFKKEGFMSYSNGHTIRSVAERDALLWLSRVVA